MALRFRQGLQTMDRQQDIATGFMGREDWHSRQVRLKVGFCCRAREPAG